MQAAAQALLNQIEILASPPTNARSFLVLDDYGRGVHAPSGDAYKQTVFSGLYDLHTRTNGTKLDVSYVDFATIWDGVLGADPGFAAFGYVSTDSCNQCSDPDHYFYWISGYVISRMGTKYIDIKIYHDRHPSKETHRIMADFVSEVWQMC